VLFCEGDREDTTATLIRNIPGNLVTDLLRAIANDIMAKGFLDLNVNVVVKVAGVVVYANKETDTPLEEDQFITGFGASKKEPILIVFPTGISLYSFSMYLLFLIFFFYLLSINVFAKQSPVLIIWFCYAMAMYKLYISSIAPPHPPKTTSSSSSLFFCSSSSLWVAPRWEMLRYCFNASTYCVLYLYPTIEYDGFAYQNRIAYDCISIFDDPVM
jgi:hypothetical protein